MWLAILDLSNILFFKYSHSMTSTPYLEKGQLMVVMVNFLLYMGHGGQLFVLGSYLNHSALVPAAMKIMMVKTLMVLVVVSWSMILILS